MKLVYFAWVREKIGTAEEKIELPETVTNVSELFEFLKNSDEKYASAFANEAIINVAIDHEQVSYDTAIIGAHEIAFFPPMTGG
ncbi:molybdopterin converting factor subunit 1 [Bartonella sp. HY406]|uniref:molybdopterin converting factor subunit 1 n=1 Tax=Bartonella sp. HY406 TaxID=2979331 RepID=UPI0021CA3AA5|nr:molybdopterin converting factor subunit 1 [Bartonella sp. HY406]UXN04377.1 molybdopterin converting factor subunit 1 [Bartonella sp. HY406]